MRVIAVVAVVPHHENIPRGDCQPRQRVSGTLIDERLDSCAPVDKESPIVDLGVWEAEGV